MIYELLAMSSGFTLIESQH